MNYKIDELKREVEQNPNESSLSSAEKTFADEGRAARAFALLKTKLLNVSEWNDHALMSSYEVFDENGQTLPDQILAADRRLRISLKGSGKYDWVRVLNITDAPDEFIITVKPTFDPTDENADEQTVSHFFTDAATNNFCLVRKAATVSLAVIGLGEKQNTDETKNALETIRNVAVNLGTYLGVQKTEWEKFCHGFIECAADELEQSA